MLQSQQKQEFEKGRSNELQIQQEKELQQDQLSSFKLIQERLKTLPERVELYKNIENKSQFQKILVEEITERMNNLNQYQDNFKIYVVFMGTLSAGKSTFINALLGQQLLPSKNQNCTSQVTYIWHQNTTAYENTKITINKQEFHSLVEASEKLTEINEPSLFQQMKNIITKPMEILNIKTQSYFHKTLNKDLQDKVFFIDTPGIELSKTSPKQYLEHFGKINSLIKLDENSIRINLQILNYTTFDSDKELQKNMNFMTKNEDEQIGKQNIANQQQQQNYLRYLNGHLVNFFTQSINMNGSLETIRKKMCSRKLKILFNLKMLL